LRSDASWLPRRKSPATVCRQGRIRLQGFFEEGKQRWSQPGVPTDSLGKRQCTRVVPYRAKMSQKFESQGSIEPIYFNCS
jgi:hypothetical protein